MHGTLKEHVWEGPRWKVQERGRCAVTVSGEAEERTAPRGGKGVTGTKPCRVLSMKPRELAAGGEQHEKTMGANWPTLQHLQLVCAVVRA
jgi:hypothetical protein